MAAKYFTPEWFYEKFNLPEAEITVDNREYSVSVEVSSSEEDRTQGKVPVETMEIQLFVEMPRLIPCVFLVGLDEKDDPFDDDAAVAALSALQQIYHERFSMGLVAYWYFGLDRDEPGYRPLSEMEKKNVSEYISRIKKAGPLCLSAQDAITTIERFCTTLVNEIDENESAAPVLSDHLCCFLDLKKEILLNGLPTIVDDNMFYEIPMNRLAVAVQLCHVKVEHFLHKKLELFEPDSSEYGSALVPHRTKLYTVKYPLLSCAEYAERYEVDQATVRQWIRRCKIRTACKVGRDWMIPVTTRLPSRGFTPGRYTYLKCAPEEVLAQYPFLKQLLPHCSISVEKAGPGKFFVMKNGYSVRGEPQTSVLSVMQPEEREKFEFLILEADWIICDLEERILKTVTKKK